MICLIRPFLLLCATASTAILIYRCAGIILLHFLSLFAGIITAGYTRYRRINATCIIECALVKANQTPVLTIVQINYFDYGPEMSVRSFQGNGPRKPICQFGYYTDAYSLFSPCGKP